VPVRPWSAKPRSAGTPSALSGEVLLAVQTRA
jgi:hypothetical protein